MKRGLRIGTAITCLLLIGGTVLVPASASAAALRVCPSSGPGCPFTSIQAAINAASGSGSVSIAPGTYRENVTIGPGTASPITLVAEGGPGAVVIDGQQRGSVVSIGAGHTVTLVGLTLMHGKVTGDGGGISNVGGTVTVIRGLIVDNTANGSINNNQGFGGGVFNTDALPPASGGGTLKMVASVVRGNTASNGGGVSTISLSAATHAELVDTVVENNTATTGGAGGVQNCGTLEMVGGSIRGNTATQGGGLSNCGNPPAGPSGNARLVNTPITGNHAVGTQATFPGGPPAGHGGGVSNGGTLMLVSSPVSGNSATGPGGGIFNAPPGTVTRISSAVTNNAGTPPAAANCFGTSC